MTNGMDETSPRFSIVIPLYNKEREVERCIRSVFAQTEPDFEVIVIDDGSQDDGPAIVRSFSDRRLKFCAQENQGLSATRNRGIDLARGQWIAFIDADDEWLPSHLASLALLAQDNPAAQVLLTAFWVRGSSGRMRRIRVPSRFLIRGTSLLTDYFSLPGEFILPSGTAALKTAIQAAGGYRKMFGEDVDLLSRMAAMYPLAYRRTATAIWHLDAQNRLCTDQKAASKLHELGSLTPSLAFIEGLSWVSSDRKAAARRFVMRRERKAVLNTLWAGDREHAWELFAQWRKEFDVDDRQVARILSLPDLAVRIWPWMRATLKKVVTAAAYAQELPIKWVTFRNSRSAS